MFPGRDNSSAYFKLQIDIYWPHTKALNDFIFHNFSHKTFIYYQISYKIAKTKWYKSQHAEAPSWKCMFLSLDSYSMIIQPHLWLLHYIYFPIFYLLWLTISFYFIGFGMISSKSLRSWNKKLYCKIIK